MFTANCGLPDQTYSTAVNDRGDITGSCGDWSIKRVRAFVRAGESGIITTFDAAPQNGSETYAAAINNRGDITGYWSLIPDAYRDMLCTQQCISGFFRDHQGAIEVFDAPGAAVTYPYLLNDRGDIVGRFVTDQQESHYFIRTRN